MVVDLLFASSGIEREIVTAAISLDIGAAAVVKVARVGHLVALKLLAQDPVKRPQDALDLHGLREVLDEEETQLAKEACALIVERGYGRRRDLSAHLASYIATTRTTPD